MQNQFSLLQDRHFLPLFTVQFLGAFNDNFLKTLVVVRLAYGLWDTHGTDAAMLVSLAAALFILPFVVFCPFAGALSDKFDKAMLVRRIKLAEIMLAALGVAALYSQSVTFALVMVFFMGVHSAFFTPNKFSILPQHLKADELVAGNGLVSTGTYVAILLGTILGSALTPVAGGVEIAAAMLMAAAGAGYFAARFIPSAPPDAEAAAAKLSLNILNSSWDSIRFALAQRPAVLIAILMTAWFYFVASTFHAQFPNFTKQVLSADTLVLSLFMVIFSAGITLGGLLNNKLLQGRPTGFFIPLACAAMGLFGMDIYFAAGAFPPAGALEGLRGLGDFLSNPQGLRLCADMFLQAVAGGFLVVPLRAIVQARTALEVRARVIAASNMMDAVFMLVSAILAMALFSVGMRIEELYLLVSSLTLAAGIALFRAESLRERKDGSV